MAGVEKAVQALEQGKTTTDAARVGGLTRARLSELLRTPALRDEVERRCVEQREAAERIVMRVQPLAVNCLVDLLENEDAKVRMGAARDLLVLGHRVGPKMGRPSPVLQISAIVEDKGGVDGSGYKDGDGRAGVAATPDL